MKVFASLLVTLCIAACSAPREKLTPDERSIIDRIRQIRELRAGTAVNWPGFDAPEYDTPLLYYTDSVCYAVNPTSRFRDEFDARLVYSDADMDIYKTTLPDSASFHMETEMIFDDTARYNSRMPFLRCSSPEITARTVEDVTSDSVWLPMVLHEYTHGYQFRQPGFAETFSREMISTPEGELARLHMRLDWFGRAIEAENKALLTALETDDPICRDSSVRSFLGLRAERKRQMAAEMGDSTVRAEEIYEIMEGMARYIEAEAGFRLGVYKPSDKWLYDTRSSGYFFATGYNLMRLIDKCGVDKSRILTREILPLETFLTTENND